MGAVETNNDKSKYLTNQFTANNAGAWIPFPRWYLDSVLPCFSLNEFGRFFAAFWNLTVGGRPVRSESNHVAGHKILLISTRDWAKKAAINPNAASRFLVAMARCRIVNYLTAADYSSSGKSEIEIITAALFDCELMADFVSALDDEIETENATRQQGGKRRSNNADFATAVHATFLRYREARMAGNTPCVAGNTPCMAGNTPRVAENTGRVAGNTPP
jgi:hypothetical protein